MINGVLTVNLFLPAVGSLKEKRRLLKSLIERLKSHFNIAVVEVNAQDAWQRTVLAIAAISKDKPQIDKVFEEVVGFIEKFSGVVLSDYKIDFFGLYLTSEDSMDELSKKYL